MPTIDNEAIRAPLRALRKAGLATHEALRALAAVTGPDAIFQVRGKGRTLIAHLGCGVEMPPEVEATCDIVVRWRIDNQLEWLKNRDSPLPPVGTPL